MHTFTKRFVPALAIVCAAAFAFAFSPRRARAESGDFNLHLDAMFAVPVYGDLAPSGADLPLGGGGLLGVDWQLAPPLAIEVIGGAGALVPRTGSAAGFGMVGAGIRVRFLDNHEGYANEPGGDYDGNAWAALHIGYLNLDGSEFGIDAGVGYEFSVLKPIQLGVFARAWVGLLGDRNQVDILFTAGLEASLAIGEAAAVDTDGDGLSDERESARWHTIATNPDTDGDGIGDGVEAHTDTDPTNVDSDGDGLQDGVEDANHNGSLNEGESDPRHADTDGGGSGDGWEHGHQGYDLRNPSDDDQDHDHVTDEHDECLGTPPGTEVSPRGCAMIREQLVLEGINFETDSTAILPTSETSLQRALSVLTDNPDVHVEVAGYTDNVGNHPHNVQLSQGRASSVRDWLVQHGVDRARLSVHGYAEARPRADNSTEEGRAQNRRIEFRRTGGQTRVVDDPGHH